MAGMFRPLILSLLVLLFVPGPILAEQTSRVVLIEAASERPGSGQADFNSSLTNALANYLDYYFFRTGRQAQLVSVPPGRGEHYIDSLLSGSSNVSLTHLVVGGEFEDRLSSYTDHRRVSRFIIRPNCLRIEVEITVYEKSDEQQVSIEPGLLTERDRHYWLEFESGEQARRLDSLLAVTAEPHEYLVRRMIERLFPLPDEYGPRETGGTSQIPAIVLVDSSFVDEIGNDWRSDVSALLSSASYFLDREFGYSLNLARIAADNGGIDSDIGPQERFKLFQRRTPKAGDTLIIGLYSRNRVEDFFGPRETDAIGLSVTGDGRLLLRQLPLGRSENRVWRGHINSLVLVHELGHVMGAIHVSDPNSIMCHNATWLAPAQFDDFNREMVAAALKGDSLPAAPMSTSSSCLIFWKGRLTTW